MKDCIKNTGMFRKRLGLCFGVAFLAFMIAVLILIFVLLINGIIK